MTWLTLMERKKKDDLILRLGALGFLIKNKIVSLLGSFLLQKQSQVHEKSHMFLHFF